MVQSTIPISHMLKDPTILGTSLTAKKPYVFHPCFCQADDVNNIVVNIAEDFSTNIYGHFIVLIIGGISVTVAGNSFFRSPLKRDRRVDEFAGIGRQILT